MNTIASLTSSPFNSPANSPDRSLLESTPLSRSSDPDADKEPLKEAFGQFVGQTLFGSMMASMRESVGKPAYFHGGRTEEVFQEQLDKRLVEAISDASAGSIVDPMFELFQLQRRA